MKKPPKYRHINGMTYPFSKSTSQQPTIPPTPAPYGTPKVARSSYNDWENQTQTALQITEQFDHEKIPSMSKQFKQENIPDITSLTSLTPNEPKSLSSSQTLSEQQKTERVSGDWHNGHFPTEYR